jgi:hypothetical protein
MSREATSQIGQSLEHLDAFNIWNREQPSLCLCNPKFTLVAMWPENTSVGLVSSFLIPFGYL